MMDQLIQEFPDQLAEALEIGKKANISNHNHPINTVLVCGLGGSGIGGNFIEVFTRDERKVPFLVSKSYELPGYVNQHTLVIFSSYSGNTEETVSAFEQAKGLGAKVVCIASGGKLLDEAKENGFDYIAVPSGKPSPRACLGYSIVQQLFILNKLDIISEKRINELEKSIDFLKTNQEEIKSKANHIAGFLENKIPVVYCVDTIEPVAIRLRQQINENAKMLCWHHVIPEMNHNELVGWKAENNDVAVLILRTKEDYYRNQVRIDINKEIISKLTGTLIEVLAKGDNLMEHAMYLVHLGDWISWYLSELNDDIDAVEVDVINFLKGELAKA